MSSCETLTPTCYYLPVIYIILYMKNDKNVISMLSGLIKMLNTGSDS